MTGLKTTREQSRNPHGVVVGMQVFAEMDYRGRDVETDKVTKIGRQFATTQRGRFDLRTLVYDQGRENCTRRVWLSLAAFLEHLAHKSLWHQIQTAVGSSSNARLAPQLTSERLHRLAAILRECGIPIGENQ